MSIENQDLTTKVTNPKFATSQSTNLNYKMSTGISSNHKDTIIYSCAGVGSFILALIIILLCYCILKRKLNERNVVTSNFKDQHSPTAVKDFNFGNGAFINKDSICYEISIKVLTPWIEVYSNHDSDEFLNLKRSIETSTANLYANYEAFKYATLVSFREGSVIANIQLTFASFAKYPLKIVQEAVCFGRFYDLNVDKRFFLEHQVNRSSEFLFNSKLPSVDGDNMGYKSSSSQSSLHDHLESGYGSQTFETSTLPKKHNLVQSCSADSLKSNTSMKNSITSNTNVPKTDKSINLKDTLKSLNSLVKKNNNKKIGIPHVGLFNFLPQDDKDLAFKQGEVVYVDYVDNGGWAKATNQNGRKGWIPQNFVVPFDLEQYEHTKKAVESILYLDSVIDSITSPDDEDSSNQLAEEADKYSEEFTKSDGSNENLDPPRSSHFITIFPFEPCEQNELKLEVGDLVDVLKTSETGWWKGRCLRTECDGWFPSSYVQINELKNDCAYPSNGLIDRVLFKTEPPSKPVPPKPRKRHIQDKLINNPNIEERSQSCSNADKKDFFKQSNINHKDKKIIASKSDKDYLSPIDKLRPRSFQDTPQNNFFKLSNKFNNNMKPAWSLPSLNVGEQVKLSPDDDRPFLEPIPRKNKRYSVPNDSLYISQLSSDGNIALKTEVLHSEVSKNSIESESVVNENSFSANVDLRDSSREDNNYLLKNDNTIKKTPPLSKNCLENDKPIVYEGLSQNVSDQKMSGSSLSEDDDFIQRVYNKEIDSNRHSRLRTGHKRFSNLKNAIIEESECISPDEDTKKELDVSLKNNEATLKNVNKLSTQTSSLNSDGKFLYEQDDQVGSSKLFSQGLKNSYSTQSLSSIASSTRSNPSTKLEQMNVRRAIANVVANSEHELTFSVGAILYELRPRNKEGLSYGILEDSNQGWYPSDAVEPYFIF
ncbi:uncharacterized protein LOC100211309 isoform X4 [Hydra vulgaris]|uniref:Uncharacterized protein LOC100211309 isoform X4 n=1 Tax=Hydra vulgaris TaxID=6087 RepID=A0ABM4D224_HYDVU